MNEQNKPSVAQAAPVSIGRQMLGAFAAATTFVTMPLALLTTVVLSENPNCSGVDHNYDYCAATNPLSDEQQAEQNSVLFSAWGVEAVLGMAAGAAAAAAVGLSARRKRGQAPTGPKQ